MTSSPLQWPAVTRRWHERPTTWWRAILRVRWQDRHRVASGSGTTRSAQPEIASRDAANNGPAAALWSAGGGAAAWLASTEGSPAAPRRRLRCGERGCRSGLGSDQERKPCGERHEHRVVLAGRIVEV